MSLRATCTRTGTWLHRTVHSLLSTQSRSVSTSSAINRGLRAEDQRERRVVRQEDRGRKRQRRGGDHDTSSKHTQMRCSDVRSEQKDKQRPTSQPKPTSLNQTCHSLLDIVTEIQTQEARKANCPPEELLKETRALVSRVNELADSGSGGAIAAQSALRKTGSNRAGFVDGTVGVRPDGKRTVVFLGPDRQVRLVEKGKVAGMELIEEGSRGGRGVGRSMRESRDGTATAAASKHQASRRQDPSPRAGASELDQQPMSRKRDARAKPTPSQEDFESDIPLSIPYTTAASTFLYGTNTVLAALKANRRKLYHLYLHPRISSNASNAETIEKLALEANIPVHKDTDLRLLDKISDNRPHNGVLLEASRLPLPPALSLGRPNPDTATIPLYLAPQNTEDMAVNGTRPTLPSLTNTWRHPFIVMLDGITDPGNLGNILRTCHFYGVDAVAVATNTCANLSSPALAKASSGACEAVSLLALPRPSEFVYECRRMGWRCYGAFAPAASPHSGQQGGGKTKTLTSSFISAASPLAKHPCILMLGAEGEGLRDNLKRRADAFVSISAGERATGFMDVGVESLNVGLAAGVLVDAFLRRPPEQSGGLGF